MPPTSRPDHIDHATLRRFALGQLPDETMGRVERHLAGCGACALVAEAVPGDRLMGLLLRVSPVAVEVTPSAPSRSERGSPVPGVFRLRTRSGEDRE